MIRAIIFDCFGVLTTDAWLPFKSQYFGHDPALLEQAGDLNKQSDSGLISYGDFLDRVGSMAGITAKQVEQAVSHNNPNSEIFEYIRQLKANYKIGLLSNASGNWLTDLFTPEQVALFDATALSYETRYIKPDRNAYAVVADRLGVTVGECVFIDDQERYITGAREAGMQAVWYKDNEQLVSELTTLLANSKD